MLMIANTHGLLSIFSKLLFMCVNSFTSHRNRDRLSLIPICSSGLSILWFTQDYITSIKINGERKERSFKSWVTIWKKKVPHFLTNTFQVKQDLNIKRIMGKILAFMIRKDFQSIKIREKKIKVDNNLLW